MRFVYISAPLGASIESDSRGLEPHIQYFGHKHTLREDELMVHLRPDRVRDGELRHLRRVQMRTHNDAHSMRLGMPLALGSWTTGHETIKSRSTGAFRQA